MYMRLNKTISLALAAACLFALPACVTTSQETEALRSDMAVLEQEFLQMQRELTRLKYEEEKEGADAHADTGVADETEFLSRISGLESRVSSLESQVAYLQQSRPPVDAIPMEPEPVGIPEEAPPPIVVEPAGPKTGKKAPTRTVEEMYKDAVGKFRDGNLDDAQFILEQLLDQYPEDNKYSDNAQYYLASVFYKRGDYHRAIEEFDKVSLNYPVGDKVPDAIYMTGLCYRELGLVDRADLNFKKVMDNYPYSDAALKARQALERAE